MKFLAEEIEKDTSKIDIVQNPKYDYTNMVDLMIFHYKKL